VPAHYAGREPGVLDIFSKYFFINTSNILEYARICSNILNISLSGGRGGLTGEAGGRTDNPGGLGGSGASMVHEECDCCAG
jgi:hypothetical protein